MEEICEPLEDPCDEEPTRDEPASQSNPKELCGEFKVDRLPPEKADILPPDHPLLQKFQDALKDHLNKLKFQLDMEIAALRNDEKQAKKDWEEAGIVLYDKQQIINGQHARMDEMDEALRIVCDERKRIEQEIVPMQDEKDKSEDQLRTAKEVLKKKRIELDHYNTLELTVQKWAKEIEDELRVMKTTAGKDAKMQKQLAEDKKKSDMIVFNLEMEILNRQKELDDIQEQIRDQKATIETLNGTYYDASSDLDALQNEHKRITQAWKEVIVCIQHRDKVLCKGREDQDKLKENLKLTSSSIQSVKKLMKSADEESKVINGFKSRLEEDYKIQNRNLEKELEIQEKLDAKLEEVPLLIEQTDKDLTEAKKEATQINKELRDAMARVDKWAMEKLRLEDDFFKEAQEQIITDNASSYSMRLLKESQRTRRTMELNLSTTENSLSEVLLELERTKGLIQKLTLKKEKLDEERRALDADVDKERTTLKDIEYQIDLKMRKIEKLNDKIGSIVTRAGGELNPVDLMIYNMEKKVSEAEQEIRSKQEFWLMLQGHIVAMKEKQNNQYKESTIARKELMIINQKSILIDNELEDAQKAGKEISIEISRLEAKFEQLGGKLFKHKIAHEKEETDYYHRHSELINDLREKETLACASQQEIEDIQKEVEDLKLEVLEHHREALAWETKYKVIEDTLRWLKEEKSKDGEITQMKQEIRRMEVRYHQLKRAQEKLVQDLQHCVVHRAQIYEQSEMKNKLEKSGSLRIRSVVQSKINDLKGKIKKIQLEFSRTEKALAEVTEETRKTQEAISRKEDEVKREKITQNLLNVEIEQAMLIKYQNLESIVRKQNRAKANKRLITSTSLPKLKSDVLINSDFEKAKEENDDLIEIVEALRTDYPEKGFVLTKLLNILRDD